MPLRRNLDGAAETAIQNEDQVTDVEGHAIISGQVATPDAADTETALDGGDAEGHAVSPATATDRP